MNLIRLVDINGGSTLIQNFKYTDKELKELLQSIVVIIDSREKKQNHITDWFDKKKIPYETKALSNGDYNFYLPANEDLGINRDLWFTKDIMFERKASLDELAGNLTKHRARFEEELATTKALSKYLIIENATYADVVNGNYKSDYNSKSYLGTLHSFNHKYDLQIVFMPDPSYTPVFLYGTMQYYLRDILK